MPGDPAGSVALGWDTSGSGCFVTLAPLDGNEAMPTDDPRAIIDGIHEALDDDQGLVEVQTGASAAGRPFSYSVVKTAQVPSGVQYGLLLHLLDPDEGRQPPANVAVQGYFDEAGITGIRDAFVYNRLLKQEGRTPGGSLDAADMAKWRRDPYDPAFTRGNLMNLSERPEYDETFPEHPLSQLRRFVRALLAEN